MTQHTFDTIKKDIEFFASETEQLFSTIRDIQDELDMGHSTALCDLEERSTPLLKVIKQLMQSVEYAHSDIEHLKKKIQFIVDEMDTLNGSIEYQQITEGLKQ